MAGREVVPSAIPADVNIRRAEPSDWSGVAELLDSDIPPSGPNHWPGTAIVAYRRGDIVGAVNVVARRVVIGSRTEAVLQIRRIVTREPTLCGLLANAACDLHPGSRALLAIDETGLVPIDGESAWEPFGRARTVLRVHQPARAFGLPGRAVLDPLVHTGVAVADRIRRTSTAVRRTVEPTPIDVIAANEVPVALIAELHDAARPERVHFARDAAAVRQLFADSHQGVRTYVGYHHGGPVGAIVLGAVETNHVMIAEVAPYDLADRHPLVFDTLINQVIDEQPRVSLIRTTESVMPPSSCRRWGFASVRRIPLRWWWRSPQRRIRVLKHPVSVAGGATTLRDVTRWQIVPADRC